MWAKPNKSLDASGTSGLVVDNLSVTWLSPAASTQSLYRFAMLRSFFITIALVVTPALSLAQNESRNPAEKLHHDGYNLFIQRDYRKALEAFQKELPLRRAMHDTSGEAWSLNQIGECYSSLSEWKPALHNYTQALALFKQVKDSHGEARTLHGIATCQAALGNNVAALESLTALLPLVHSSEDRQWEGTVLGDIGLTYLALGKNETAFEYLNRRLAFERTQVNRVGEADALESLGSAYQSLGNKLKALDSYRDALSILMALSQTMTSDHLTTEIAQLKGVIAKLER